MRTIHVENGNIIIGGGSLFKSTLLIIQLRGGKGADEIGCDTVRKLVYRVIGEIGLDWIAQIGKNPMSGNGR